MEKSTRKSIYFNIESMRIMHTELYSFFKEFTNKISIYVLNQNVPLYLSDICNRKSFRGITNENESITIEFAILDTKIDPSIIEKLISRVRRSLISNFRGIGFVANEIFVYNNIIYFKFTPVKIL